MGFQELRPIVAGIDWELVRVHQHARFWRAPPHFRQEGLQHHVGIVLITHRSAHELLEPAIRHLPDRFAVELVRLPFAAH